MQDNFHFHAFTLFCVCVYEWTDALLHLSGQIGHYYSQRYLHYLPILSTWKPSLIFAVPKCQIMSFLPSCTFYELVYIVNFCRCFSTLDWSTNLSEYLFRKKYLGKRFFWKSQIDKSNFYQTANWQLECGFSRIFLFWIKQNFV